MVMIFLWYLDRGNGGRDRAGQWKARKIITIPAEPADPATLPPLLQGFRSDGDDLSLVSRPRQRRTRSGGAVEGKEDHHHPRGAGRSGDLAAPAPGLQIGW